MQMRKTAYSIVAVVALASIPVHADLLAAWDTWVTAGFTPQTAVSGFESSVISAGTANSPYINSYGSTNGTYGDDVSGASTALGTLLLSPYNCAGTVTFTLTNNSAEDYYVDGLHFDFTAREKTSNAQAGYNAFVLEYTSGGLGPASTMIDTQTDLPYTINGSQTGEQGDYPGYDYALSSYLTDITLAAGESAIFTMTFDGAADAYLGSPLDNVAFTGTVAPEPATMGLLSPGRRWPGASPPLPVSGTHGPPERGGA